LDAPIVEGNVSIAPFNPRPLMRKLAIELAPGRKQTLRKVSLSSKIKADLNGQSLAFSGLVLTLDTLSLKGEVQVNKFLDAPRLSGQLEMPSFAPAAVIDLLHIDVQPRYRDALAKGAVKARFSADWASQTLEVTRLSAKFDRLVLSARVRVSKFMTAPRYKGVVQVAAFDLRRLLNKSGFSYDVADKRVLRRVKFASNFKGSPDGMVFSEINATVDSSVITGMIEIKNFTHPAYRIDLDVGEVDLDRYVASGRRRAAVPKVVSGRQPQPLQIPLGIVRDLDLQAHARFARLKVFGLHSSDVSVRLAAKAGLMTIGPNRATLYGGRYQGNTTIDVRRKVPKITIREGLTHIQLGPFLKDANMYKKFSGTGDITVNLTARGYDTGAILRTLNGKGVIVVRNGKVEGVNLQKSINRARVQYEMLRGRPVSVVPDASDETVFTHLASTITLSNGVAQNNDLRMQGRNLRATGKGAASLPKETINYRLNVTVAEAASSRGITVPVDIRGTFSQPTYSVAWNEVLQAQVQRSIQKKFEDSLRKKLKDKFKLKF
ncbi:MAG: AsmA-like C-terminal region-containing protein, partial [Acidiferrobacterales bacterium]